MQTPKWPAVATATFVVVCLGILVARFNVTTDIGLFLPKGKSLLERVLMTQLDQGSTSNLVFAGISGANRERLAELNRGLADRLSEQARFVQALNGERSLSESDQEWVMENRYLLTSSNLGERLTVEGLRRALDERLRGLASPLGALEKKFLARDPTGEILDLFKRYQADFASEAGPE